MKENDRNIRSHTCDRQSRIFFLMLEQLFQLEKIVLRSKKCSTKKNSSSRSCFENFVARNTMMQSNIQMLENITV